MTSSNCILTQLTIAIPVKNEESNLAVCLQAIGSDFCSRVVVIDSSSSDSTSDVARNYGVDVIDFHWDGHFPKKRNWFLRHHTPSTEWVLFLDADEILTSAVKLEIASALSDSTHQGFLLSYTNYFLGRRLQGGYPLRKLALFRVGEVEYERIEEDRWSQCDMEVHEHPVVSGSIGLIRSRIDHRDLRGIDSYLCKHNEYAAWEAHRLYQFRHFPPSQSAWKPHQRFKYSLISSPWGGLAFFLVSFFAMGGWRDGSTGFAFCLLKAAYFTQIACRLRELENQNHTPLPPVY
ncbi:glycosyltransferase [Synechococcus sp. RS9902]|uniref:glycosyltransferase n=1 Tax=Synechococcus sp. RS9902 TaxID=221345 RepID=UPI001861C489|nr:glycosyltransferase [Synechococcus sp. RS9902]QNI97103.1 beta-glycosyltransferase/ family 2 [Synechococcus sp. RS9902]